MDTSDISSPSFVDAIIYFFSSSNLPLRVKHSAITFISKGPYTEDIKDYRPLSHCNILYNVIAKLLTDRMKVLLSPLIHSPQVSFIKGCDIVDNVILANEILHGFNQKCYPKSFCEN